MKKKLIFCLCAFVNIFLYANEIKFDCAQLLNSYLEHDLTLQKLLLEVSKSELNFFGNIRDLKRNYLKHLDKKEFK